MRNIIESGEDVIVDLVAVASHSGSPSGGHCMYIFLYFISL